MVFGDVFCGFCGFFVGCFVVFFVVLWVFVGPVFWLLCLFAVLLDICSREKLNVV